MVLCMLGVCVCGCGSSGLLVSLILLFFSLVLIPPALLIDCDLGKLVNCSKFHFFQMSSRYNSSPWLTYLSWCLNDRVPVRHLAQRLAHGKFQTLITTTSTAATSSEATTLLFFCLSLLLSEDSPYLSMQPNIRYLHSLLCFSLYLLSPSNLL